MKKAMISHIRRGRLSNLFHSLSPWPTEDESNISSLGGGLRGWTSLLICLAVLSTTLNAQQYPLFSNYWTQAYGFNPAVITTTDGVMVNAVYRQQWVGLEGAPITKLAAAQAKLGRWSTGGYFFQDEAGVLQRTGGSLMLAYEQPLGLNASLSAGLAGGYYNMRLRKGAEVRQDADPLVLDAMSGAWFPDFNVGVQLRVGDWLLGVSVPQIIDRKIRFMDSEMTTNLQRHYYLTTAYTFQLNEQFQLQPAVLVKLAEGGEPQYDASLRAIFLQKYWLGGSYRVNESAIGMVGVQLNSRVDLTYAYDFTTSGLRTVSKGSHEIGLSIRLGDDRLSDRDRDGTPDVSDDCPDEVGPMKNHGCPFDIFSDEEVDQSDSDGDGTWDELDECPEIPGPKDNQGCPWADRDFDGIPDEVDECPGLAGVADNNGCPIEDRDLDGIVDQFDECPDEPGTFLSRGCPDKDFDHDGVFNSIDACPNTYGPKSNGGCPIVGDPEKEVINVAMRNLYFESNKTEIYYKTYAYLDQVAELMLDRSDWQLRIIGHTDDRGGAAGNLEVSKRRAEAVLFYLINQGVDREQLILEYYGETQPFAENNSESGRQLNRRVELAFKFN